MDIIRYYLLPNSTALKLYYQKYEYVTKNKYIFLHIYIILFLVSILIGSFKNSVPNKLFAYKSHTHTHTHTYINRIWH